MIDQKENDWILNLIENQQMAIADFKEVGLNADNTSLLSENVYTQSDKITKNPLFQDEQGNFSSTKFHDFYKKAQLTYNMLSDQTFLDKSAEEATTFGYDNTLVSKDRRKSAEDLVQIGRIANPNRTTTGLIRVGVTENPTMSASEIAQREKVLANPVEASKDPSKAIWHDSPNDSWFTDFFDTRVLAAWDEDGTHEDPITGNIIEHKKGDLKLNDNGVYYYENLDGRDIYGKQVLNKLNTLTTDGSKWNKYDFFDSDDLQQKSIGGNVLKNLALVGTMFIPYVGPYIAGLSVATQLVGLFGTLGKMLSGSNSPTFSALEGWSKSVNRQTLKTQYAQENTWCWENFISLIGDVAGQLKEQRFIFEYAPAMFKGNSILGKNGISNAKKEKFIAEQTAKYKELNTAKFEELVKRGATQQELNSFQDAINLGRFKAEADYEKFFNTYNHIGSVLSKGYMTAITVGDTYGEAKLAGATDLEATMLTLGYAAAEAALLNTEVGGWILPELKASGLQNQAMIKAIVGAQQVAEQTSKQGFAKHWFNVGKKLATDLSMAGKGLEGQMISGGLGEGFEETTEELLADFSKSAFNLYQWLKGSDTRMSAWDNMLDRYSMSFVGGVAGGALTAAGTNFKTNFKDMTPEEAGQLLIYKIRNKQESDIFKALDRITISDKNLSNIIENGSFKPSDKNTPSRDQDVKQAFKNQVDIIKSILNAENLTIPDSSFIDIQTFKDVQLAQFQKSPISTLFLQDFNTLCSDLIKEQEAIISIKNKYEDSAKISDEDLQIIQQHGDKLKQLREKRQQYLDGSLAMDYISKAAFDLSPISRIYTTSFFSDYVKQNYNRDVEDLNEEEAKKYRQEFEDWKNTEYKNKISTLAPLYLQLARNSSQFIQEFAKNYQQVKNNRTLQDLINSKINQGQVVDNLLIQSEMNQDLDSFINGLSQIYESDPTNTALVLLYQNESIRNKIQALGDNKQAISDLMSSELSGNVSRYFSQFYNQIINPEIKIGLLNTANIIKNWVNKQNFKIELSSQEIMDETGLQESDLLDTVSTWYPEIVNNIKSVANSLGITVKTVGDVDNLIDELNKRDSEIDKVIENLNQAPYTDAITFIQNFIQTNSDSKLDIVKLLTDINTMITESSVDTINLEQYKEQLDEAAQVIGWLQGLVLGAQTDSDGTLGNLLGYNKTLNDIAKKHKVQWEELPEITIQDSSIINQDLQLIKDKIKQAQNIYSINTSKKLNLQNRTSANKIFLEYNRLKRFIITVGDDWKEKNKLQEAINNAELLNKIAETRDQKSLTDESRKQLETESVAIQDALFDFFNANQDKDLSQLFRNGFDLYKPTNQVINDITEQLDDQNFVWWLAVRAAIKASSFNKVLSQVIPDDGFAPIPVQEESVFQNVASVLNGDIISKFRQAYIKAAIDNFHESSPEEQKRILRERLGYTDDQDIERFIQNDEIVSNSILPQFDNIHLTEGIPGAGKSSAVNYYTAQILKKVHPDSLRKVAYVHNNTELAQKSVEEIGLENATIYQQNDFLTLIDSHYNPNRAIDSEGRRIYDKDDFIVDNGKIKYKYQPNDLSVEDIPSLIIIDEISHYDEPQLQLIDSLAKKYGITVLTAGDFDQSSAKAIVKNYSGNGDLILDPVRSQFIHSPKIGVSMRTSNSQMDKTLTSFRTSPENKPIASYYYEDQNTITGVRTLDSLNFQKSVDHMMSLLSDGEKVNFIYYNDNSDVYKYLMGKYSDKVNLLLGNAAQGSEGRFYIADMNFTGNKQDLYTAISRSSQATLAINVPPTLMYSIRENITTDVGFSKQGSQRYSRNRKTLLESLFSSAGDLKYTPRTQVATKPSQPNIQPPITPVTPSPSSIQWEGNPKSIVYNGVEYQTDGKKVYQGTTEITNDIKDKIIDIFNNLSAENQELTLGDEFNQSEVEKNIENLNNGQSEGVEVITDSSFTYLLHSHNTFEIGLPIKDGKFVFNELDRYQFRIDSAIGLLKIFEQNWTNPTNSVDSYIDMLKTIRGYLLTSDNKVDLINRLTDVFQQKDQTLSVKTIEFGLLSAPNISQNSGNQWGYTNNAGEFGVFDKRIDETTVGNANPLPESQGINRKTINAVITLNNNKRVTIPLFTLGNLETYTRDPSNALSNKLTGLYSKANGDAYKFHLSIINDPDLQRIPTVYNLAKLFLFTNAGYFKINDDTWLPSKMRNNGIQVNSHATSGGKFTFIGQTTSIIDAIKTSGFNFSKQIYTSMEQIMDSAGNMINFANIGHAFILVTQDPSIITDEQMKKQYEKQLVNKNEPKKVQLVYITPPSVSVEEYLQNLHDIVMEKDPNKRKQMKKLGSHLTSYYIWESLLPKLKDGTITQLDKKTKEKLISEIERLNSINNKTQLLNELMSTQNWESVNTGNSSQSLYRHLNFVLTSLFSNVQDGGIIQDSFNNIVSLIKQAGLTSFHYSTKFKNAQPGRDQVLVPLASDQDGNQNSLYTIDGKPFTIQAKLDSSLFSMDQSFNSIIESFVSKITSNGVRDASTDTMEFLHPHTGVSRDGLTIEFIDNKVTINGTQLSIDQNTFMNTFFIDGRFPSKANILAYSKSLAKFIDNVDVIFDEVLTKIINQDTSESTKEIIYRHLQAIADEQNNKDDNTCIVPFPNKTFRQISFTKEQLNRAGLQYLTGLPKVSTITSTEVSGRTEIKLSPTVTLVYDFLTEELIVEPNTATQQVDYDNQVLDFNNGIGKIVQKAGFSYEEDLNNYVDMYGQDFQSWKGASDIIDTFNEIKESLDITEEEKQEIQNFINYLEDDSESCQINIR